jgi:hypothetical protein
MVLPSPLLCQTAQHALCASFKIEGAYGNERMTHYMSQIIVPCHLTHRPTRHPCVRGTATCKLPIACAQLASLALRCDVLSRSSHPNNLTYAAQYELHSSRGRALASLCVHACS